MIALLLASWALAGDSGALASAAGADVSSTATTAPASPAVIDVLGAWTDRATSELVLDGLRPNRTVIAAMDEQSWAIDTSFGEVVTENRWTARPGRVEVVVGDGARDSSRFRGGRSLASPVGQPRFVVEDVQRAIGRDLWLATDSSFKNAVRQWQVKQNALAQVGSPWPADWSPAPTVVSLDAAPPVAPESERLRKLAIEGSTRLRAIGALDHGSVDALATEGRYLLATSEGTRLAQPEGYVALYAFADVKRPDGLQVWDWRQWVVRTADDLPSDAEILAEIEAMGRAVVARSQAAPLEYYEGPVVFEGRAAVDFFRYLAVPEWTGTPPEPMADRTYEQLIRSGPRIGRRLLPDGWSAWDDPTAPPNGLAGGYAYDREGVAAERVDLVANGYVTDLLMSRVPRHDRVASNGHARGDVQGAWTSRPAIWTIEADKRLSDARFDRSVERARRQASADRVLVVRNLSRGRDGALPSPTDAVWRLADGTELPVLAADFQRVDRRTLRDVSAAGGDPYVLGYFYGGSGRTSGLPTVGIAPGRILVDELEVVFPGPGKPYQLPPPPL